MRATKLPIHGLRHEFESGGGGKSSKSRGPRLFSFTAALKLLASQKSGGLWPPPPAPRWRGPCNMTVDVGILLAKVKIVSKKGKGHDLHFLQFLVNNQISFTLWFPIL